MKKVNEARKKVTPDHPRVPAEVPRHHFWQIEIGIFNFFKDFIIF